MRAGLSGRAHRVRAVALLPGVVGLRSGVFGASVAILLSDSRLVWAEEMMRESGVDERALARAWPHYDAMRVELAVGQFADVVNDARALPTLDVVLDVACRNPVTTRLAVRSGSAP